MLCIWNLYSLSEFLSNTELLIYKLLASFAFHWPVSVFYTLSDLLGCFFQSIWFINWVLAHALVLDRCIYFWYCSIVCALGLHRKCRPFLSFSTITWFPLPFSSQFHNWLDKMKYSTWDSRFSGDWRAEYHMVLLTSTWFSSHWTGG